MRNPYLVPLLLVSAAALTGCNINKSISVPAHAHVSGTSTINGDISVGEDAVVDGGLRTINGRISLASGAQTGDLTLINGKITLANGAKSGGVSAINGSVELSKNAAVRGDISTVNGSIALAPGTAVQGNIKTVNGSVALCNSAVSGNLEFYNGTVLIADGSVIQGGITAKLPTGSEQEGNLPPILIVAPHATVNGAIRFERPGKLYVSDSAVIHGVEGVTATQFAGNAPTGVTLPKCPTD